MTRNLLIAITAFGVVSAATTVSAFAAAAHGHPRTATALQASLNSCSHQTGGQKRTAPAFQQCMGRAAINSPAPCGRRRLLGSGL